MSQREGPGGHGFGTAPVFLAAISTILGAILFLRFGYAVGHVGAVGAGLVVLLGHMVTVPTALAISEIATNRRVEGGGEYFIISRSFGPRIGSAIGISLYLSQAISVAFYCIAFAEAFSPLAEPFESLFGIPFDARIVSLPVALGLVILMLTKGAAMGVKALWVVVAILAVSLLLFFLGEPAEGADGTLRPFEHVTEPDSFFLVFAICFPAFTGMTAGVGLSGDLLRPRRSIPLGTLSATFVGMLVYFAIVWKLAVSATPELLAEDQLVMARIAMWGPIIPIGLACATLSSAVGSILVAPRTLQALARDGCFPLGFVNGLLARGVGKENEPRVGTLVTGVVTLVVVGLGNVDVVARVVSMFFMVTYGALCAISFLEHFAANPGYRPSFRSRWWVSLFGAVMCVLMMFQMDPVYSVVAIVAMAGLYWISKYTPAGKGGEDLAAIFRGVMGQATRRMHVRLQRRAEPGTGRDWRPSIVSVSAETFRGSRSPLRLLGWLCARHGFATHLHHLPGMLEPETFDESERVQRRLVDLAAKEFPGLFVDTIVSPSMRSALAQTLQVPGVSGMENNTLLFEIANDDPAEVVDAAVDDSLFASAAKKNLLFLRHGERAFGERRHVHVWLTWNDADNATLMMLLAYILLGHRDWRRADMHVFAALPTGEAGEQRRRFEEVVREGRIPLSEKNVRFLDAPDGEEFRKQVEDLSSDADLVIMGITLERLREKGRELLTRHPALGDVLFVSAAEKVLLE